MAYLDKMSYSECEVSASDQQSQLQSCRITVDDTKLFEKDTLYMFPELIGDCFQNALTFGVEEPLLYVFLKHLRQLVSEAHQCCFITQDDLHKRLEDKFGFALDGSFGINVTVEHKPLL